jgi:hypothetical protein
MRAGLAVALDLTVLCLEGGLSLEHAMLREQRSASYSSGPGPRVFI